MSFWAGNPFEKYSHHKPHLAKNEDVVYRGISGEQFLGRQHNGLIRLIGRRFETLGLQTLELKAEAIALPVKDFHPVTVAIQKNKKHGVEHGDFDVQLNQRSKAVDGLSEAHRLGVEVRAPSGSEAVWLYLLSAFCEECEHIRQSSASTCLNSM